jgi:hypothetical protein
MFAAEPGTTPAEPRRLSIPLPRPLWIGLATATLIGAAAPLAVVMPAYWQRATIRTVERAGGNVRTRPGGFGWLRSCIGNGRMAIFDEAEFVNLYGSSIAEDQLPRLGQLVGLEKLILLGTPTTDKSLEHIGRLRRLRYLDLEATRVTDAGLRNLAGLDQLESLDLSQTEVGDKGLVQLESLKRLKQLRLYGARVTDAGITRLKRAIPGLNVWASEAAAP